MINKFITLIIILVSISSFAQKAESNLQYVDPTIGSVGVILEPTRPTVHLPFSMVRVFPNRKDQLDDQISNFQLTITDHRLHKVFAFMPITGDISDNIWYKKFENCDEILTPYYYKTCFEDAGNCIEFSPKERSGIYKMSFSDADAHYIRMGVYNNGEIDTEGKRIITGVEQFANMKAYFYAEINTDITDVKYRYDDNKRQVLIGIGNKKDIRFKYGISYISIGQAKKNLQNEIPYFDFNTVKNNAYKIWDKALSQIKVKGGTDAEKRVFYTAFYRTKERMVNINEYGRYYSAYDGKVHESNEPFYVDNWIWDTYIALEPLTMILDPKMAQDRIKSYIKMYEQGGTIPSFALLFGDWPAMVGNHAAPWMLDAWNKDLCDFDIKTAYEGLKKNSLEQTLIPWTNGPCTVLDSFYNDNGYMPALHIGEKETVPEVKLPWERRQAVSVTIENSYDDWAISQMAKQLDYKKDYELFKKRAGFYKNVFRTDKGFVWPKDKDGNWIEPYDPKMSDRIYFTENNAYTYNWYAKHDLKGLFALMDETYGAKNTLDQTFREDLGTSKWKFWSIQPDASGLVGQFVMGNEPSFHIPYLYNYMGEPWRTQKRIRMLLDAFFTDTYFGIPGDEDGGAMSAFVNFSMMGFFQVVQGIPVYSIGSPVFEEITIDLPNGKQFEIIAHNSSKTNKYIQSAKLNGVKLNKSWFTHQELAKGGVLELEMGSQPNKDWGTDKNTLPPSSIDYNTGFRIK